MAVAPSRKGSESCYLPWASGTGLLNLRTSLVDFWGALGSSRPSLPGHPAGQREGRVLPQHPAQVALIIPFGSELPHPTTPTPHTLPLTLPC